MNKIESLNYRYLARIIIEAATPIVVKSGESVETGATLAVIK